MIEVCEVFLFFILGFGEGSLTREKSCRTGKERRWGLESGGKLFLEGYFWVFWSYEINGDDGILS